MYRNIWFLSCVGVAGLLAVTGQALVPVVINSVAPDGIPPGLFELLSRSDSVKLATIIALFGIFAAFLGLGGQILVDSFAIRRLVGGLKGLASETGSDAGLTGEALRALAEYSSDLSEPISRYVAASELGNEQPLKVSFPAATFLSSDVQISSRLHLWFYNSLFAGLIGAGLVLFLIAIAAGIDELVFKSVILTPQPLNGLLQPLQVGVFAISITLTAAILVRLLVQFFIALPQRQLTQLTSLLDSLFLANDSSANAIAKPIRMLAEAQQQIAQDKSEQLGTVIESALSKMSEALTGEFTSQVKTLGDLMGQVEKQVASSTTAVTQAQDTLARFANGQSDAIDQAIAAALTERVKNEKKAQEGLVKSARKAMETLTTDLTKAHQATVETLETRLTTLQESLQMNAAVLPTQLTALDEAAAQDMQANLAALQATQQSTIKTIVEELVAAQSGTAKALEDRLAAHEETLREALQTIAQALTTSARREISSAAAELITQSQSAVADTLDARLATLQETFQASMATVAAELVQRLDVIVSDLPTSGAVPAASGEAAEQLQAELANLSAAIDRLASEGTALPISSAASNPVADIIGDEYMRLLGEQDDDDAGLGEDIGLTATPDAPVDTVERVGRLTDALQQTNSDDKRQRQQDRSDDAIG